MALCEKLESKIFFRWIFVFIFSNVFYFVRYNKNQTLFQVHFHSVVNWTLRWKNTVYVTYNGKKTSKN